MDSLQNILAKFDKPDQPELLAIKRYIDRHYQTPVSVAINGNNIVITVPSAALANTLRLQTTKIQTACDTDKRLVFRIG